MSSRWWKVRVYAGESAPEPCQTYSVLAPTWLSAELQAQQLAAEDFGGDPEEYEAEAEEEGRCPDV